jgi:hypothetical protein
VAAFKVDDSEAAMAEPDAGGNVESVTVRAAVRKCCGHALQQVSVHRPAISPEQSY